MIGRESELRQVESFLEGARPGTDGLLLQGEAGIGKTTNAEARWELQHKLQSGDVDPLTRAQREWERQRLQLDAAFR